MLKIVPIQLFFKYLTLLCTIAGQLLNSMYCIWKFYFQFEATVADHIKKKRSAIEKELKNFVKISRWHDMNFWSVRASVDKAHKTIAKQMKAYHVSVALKSNNVLVISVNVLCTIYIYMVHFIHIYYALYAYTYIWCTVYMHMMHHMHVCDVYVRTRIALISSHFQLLKLP